MGHYLEWVTYLDWDTFLPGESSASPVFVFGELQFRIRMTPVKDTKNFFNVYLDDFSGKERCPPFVVVTYSANRNHSVLILIDFANGKNMFEPDDKTIVKDEFCGDAKVIFLMRFENDLPPESGLFQTDDRVVLNCSNARENPCLQSLSEDFSSLLDAESDHDVFLECGDRSVRAHKIVLMSRSKVFQRMLQSGMVEGRTGHVEVKDIDSDIVAEFIRYLYTGDLTELDVDKAKKLYLAGDKYAVGSLMRRCSTFLLKEMTTLTACDYLDLAESHGDNEFKERVISYMLAKKTPLTDERWQAFKERSPAVAVDVLNRFVKLKNVA